MKSHPRRSARAGRRLGLRGRSPAIPPNRPGVDLAQRPQAATLAIATVRLSECATVHVIGLRVRSARQSCNPIVEYSHEEPRWAADEVAALPKGILIVECFADYAILRGQVRDCANVIISLADSFEQWIRIDLEVFATLVFRYPVRHH